MPLITVDYATPLPESRPAKPLIARLVARHATVLLKKREDLTAVVVRRLDPADWYVAGTDLATSGLASYALEIKVSEGTNTKAEKAAFLAAIHADLADLIGPLHPESYVHVVDARADAYGYGGLSQEYRFVAERMDQALRTATAEAAVQRFGIR